MNENESKNKPTAATATTTATTSTTAEDDSKPAAKADDDDDEAAALQFTLQMSLVQAKEDEKTNTRPCFRPSNDGQTTITINFYRRQPNIGFLEANTVNN